MSQNFAFSNFCLCYFLRLLHLWCAAYYVTGSGTAHKQQSQRPPYLHIVANVLYPPLCLAAQGRLMCLGHGQNLVRAKFPPPLHPTII